MKRGLLISFFFALQFTIQAQPYGNEWIDPTRVHYRISVQYDAMYRIPYSTLVSAIPNLNALNPANLIMYHNGQKVPLNITATGSFGSNDYIEFYGKHNDGFIDSLLYKSASYQIDPYYSLFEDNSYYYLTTNSLTTNPRYTTVTNDLTNLPPVENYFMYFTRDNYPCGIYYPGNYVYSSGDELYKPIYDVGEGYTFCNYFNNFSGPQAFTLNTPFVYSQGPNATFITNYANNSPEMPPHQTSVSFNSTVVETATFEGFHLNSVSKAIPASQIVSGTNTITYVESNQSLLSQTQDMVGCVAITYPRTYTFDGTNQFYFQVAADAVNAKYIEITNFNDDNTQPLLYDITNGLIYPSVLPAGSTPIKFHLQTSLTNREMFLRSNDGSFFTVSQLTPINFIDFSQTTNQGEYYIISNSSLYNDGSGNNWVETYRKYRDKNENPGAGKYFQARSVDIDILYDEFAYGIRKSPLAIRNFINYATSKVNSQPQWSIPLKYVFLIGKGRMASDIRAGSGTDYDQCLVPTFGYPVSDNLLAASRNNDSMLVAIGRLPAQTPQQVQAYYNKIKTYEAAQNTYAYNQDIPDKLWQKQILHFTGGTGAAEQGQFMAYVNNYAAIAVDTSYGANVRSFSKTSDQPIDQSQSQVITNDINNGVSWITFFGHSATGAFDFSIDVPENYTNYGKFPIILSNGCFSGDINEAAVGYSERFVLEANIGAIAFMATSSLALSTGLDIVSDSLYGDFCRLTYYQTLGVSLQRTFNKMYKYYSARDDVMLASYEMTLDGDPGMLVDEYPKPDYAIDASSVFFTPSVITAGMDSFMVSIVVTNLGKAIKDSMLVTLTRNIFDNSGNAVPPFIYSKNVRTPYYIDTVNFKLPVNISNLGYGQNLFSPYVDAGFKIDEMAEGNNGLTTPVTINIASDDIIPIYPYEFAIVPKQGVTLKASTVNPFAAPRFYKFQLDTTALFNSPLVQNFRMSQGGGVVHWKPSLIYKDSVVYYWRVAKDSNGATWHNSSFIYLANEYPGWNQSHYFQWQQDNYLNMSLAGNRSFQYPPTVNNISVITGVANAVGGNVDFETLGWDLNNYDEYAYRMGGCGYYSGGLTFAVIDTLTGQPLGSFNLNGDNFGDAFGNVHCSYQYSPQFGFDFTTTGTNTLYNQLWSAVIKRFIDSIKPGSYVLVYSVNAPPYTQWDNTLVQALQSLGLQAQLFQNGSINGPFVYFTQKQNVNYSSFFAYKNGGFNVPLDTNFNFIGRWYQGNMTSTLIGPAEIWGSVHWKTQTANPAIFKDTLDIIGETAAGVDTLLLTTGQNDIFINRISAVKYPFLKLRFHTTDPTLLTPAQLKYWRVLFKKPPDAAINPAAHFVMTDSVNIGSQLHVEVAVENVTDVPMDSLLTKFTVRDASFHLNYYYQRYGPLPAFDTMIMVFNQPISTASYQGLDDLIIEANPNNDQVEQYHFNNLAEVGFHGYGDNSNPLLDVTFDNQHIMNNDIVSAKPDILINLKSDNKYLALNDTSEIGVYLVYPNQTTPIRFNYDGQILKFYPADSTNLAHGNKAQAEFKPVLLTDGTYELIVRDMDRSGNNSSTTNNRNQDNLFYDYKIDFQVINKPMITNVLNYPNPFTTSTRFVFTITGSEVPDFMKIQIMTIKGTVVKEITEQEMGPLHIGTNMTQYAWDGRDQYGDPVANGVYFYKVVTRLDNKQMDAMAESYDNYFKHGIGKLVIIR